MAPNHNHNTNIAPFETIAIIGGGLIGSSIARGLKEHHLCSKTIIVEKSNELCSRVDALGIADLATTNLAEGVKDADLVLLCTPVRSFASITKDMASYLKSGTVVSDVGSVKNKVIEDVAPHLPEGVFFIPGHPIAGTENSGPEAGFSHLFHDRWLILTPLPAYQNDTDYLHAKDRLKKLWQKLGSNVEEMDAPHHDKVLAITSHLPHLIAYTIVSTATDLEDDLKEEVIKFSASGFRDFTRIAASDPEMWRDIFLTNKHAVLDIMQRFNEDLTSLQKYIRRDNGDALYDAFARTRAIRRAVIEHGQAVPEEFKKAKK